MKTRIIVDSTADMIPEIKARVYTVPLTVHFGREEYIDGVTIDHKSGEYQTFRRWEVVADDVVMESPDFQIRLMDALDESEGAEVGDYVEEQIENPDFGRIAAQTAKHVIRQGIREAERSQQLSEIQSRAHDIIQATVTRVDNEKGIVALDLGKGGEAILPRNEQVQSDTVLYAHAIRLLHLETYPGNTRALAKALVARVNASDARISPPTITFTSAAMH